MSVKFYKYNLHSEINYLIYKFGGFNMENMDCRNINNEENEVESKMSDELNQGLGKENIQPEECGELDDNNTIQQENICETVENRDANEVESSFIHENIVDPEAVGIPYEDSMVPHESFNHRKGYIAQNKPVKRNIFRKVAPYLACIVISAIVGGAAGGAYMSYAANADNQYTPPAITQGGGASTTSYTQPESLISKVASEVGPSVVGIDTQTVSQGFFGQQQMAQGSGSGIIFDKNGYIVTNQHVINGSSSITVTLAGGKTYPAKVIGQDPTSDIAVIKINVTNLPAAKLGDSSKIRVGDLAVAIGNPMGEEFAGSVTSGIISALNRTITMNDGGYNRRYTLIQTDAAINPGNSGGALINQNGEVIGINSIKFADSNVEGMGFAIPINDVKTIISDLLNHGYVSHPYLGVSVETITSDMAQQYNCPAGAGVDAVAPGSSAEAAGIKPGDIITDFDGVKLLTSDDLANNLAKHKAGDTIKLTIWRNGASRTVTAAVGENKGITN